MLTAACTAGGPRVAGVNGIEVTKIRVKSLRGGAAYQVLFEIKNTTKTPKIVTLQAKLATIYYKKLESPSDTIVLRKRETRKATLTIDAPRTEGGAGAPALGPYQIPEIEILSVKEAPAF
jgi:hypothetical protein